MKRQTMLSKTMKRQTIKHETRPFSKSLPIVCACVFLAVATRIGAAPTPAAVSAFNIYIDVVESRLAQQHRSTAFLAPVDFARLGRGDIVIEQFAPPKIPDALLHHWRGTAFVPGATAAGFDRLLRDFSAYPRLFAPQVLQARILAQRGNQVQAMMRVRQQHVLTVVVDTTYDVTFARLDTQPHPNLQQGYSLSRSTQISEIDSPGTAHERVLTPSEDHGFLWRLNTYWTWEERDGGLSIQIESVSLTRSIPRGLAWAIGPFVQSIPRESLQFTLRSAANALRTSQERKTQ